MATLGQNRSATRVDSWATWVSTFLAALICFGFLIVPFAIFFLGAGS